MLYLLSRGELLREREVAEAIRMYGRASAVGICQCENLLRQKTEYGESKRDKTISNKNTSWIAKTSYFIPVTGAREPPTNTMHTQWLLISPHSYYLRYQLQIDSNNITHLKRFNVCTMFIKCLISVTTYFLTPIV
jgi:hypothetical protein